MSSWQPRYLGPPLVLLFSCMAFMNLSAQEQKGVVALDSGWEFRQIPAVTPAAATLPSEWRPAHVPGDIHLDLLANKLIPEPFYRDNEAKLQWIENADWEYRKTLAVTPEMLRHDHLDLVFDGLDAYCEVYINDKLALTADNMFLGWRIDAK